MARSLVSQQNVEPPDSDFPFGRIKDDDGTGTGTHLTENVHGDYHQFFQKMMNEAGIVFNTLPDSAYSGFQFFEAFMQAVSKRVGRYSSGDDLTVTVSTNLNLYLSPGMYNVTSAYTNKPTGLAATAMLIVGGYGNVSQRIINLTDGAEWSRAWNGTTWSAWVLIRLAMTVPIQIGDWNMDTTADVYVVHGIAPEKVRSIVALIRNDANEYLASLVGSNHLGTLGGWVIDSASGAHLFRTQSGLFDNANHSVTPYNRGWVTVLYDPS